MPALIVQILNSEYQTPCKQRIFTQLDDDLTSFDPNLSLCESISFRSLLNSVETNPFYTIEGINKE